jgi:hypothetical protein
MANGLLNLQTNLKSLRYGSDKPYITKDINHPPSSNGISVQVNHRIDDLSRITQMMVDKPGLKFLESETLLKQTDLLKKLEKAENKGQFALQQAKDTALQVTKTALSTLAQVPVEGTGLHFLKAFRTDTYIRPANETDSSAFVQFFGRGGVEGAPSALRGEIIATTPQEGNTQKSNLSPEDSNYSPFSDTNTPDDRVFEGQEGVDTFGIKKTYLQTKIYDPTLNKNVTKEARVLLGDQGARKGEAKRLNQYWFASSPVDISKKVFANETDKINALDIQETKVKGETEGRDLIKFRFHIVTPDTTRILYFRAFLDSFADNYTGAWNQVKYLGRAEDMQVYSGFQRKISLSFKIAAATRAEMKPLYRKMIYLASATAPTYGDNGQFMRGTIVKLTLGDYVYELPGVLNSVNFTWQQDYPWEIAMKEPEAIDANGKPINGTDKSMQELPMILDCSIDFTPIHTFTPETGLKKYFTTGLQNAAEAGEGEGLGKDFFLDDPVLGGDPLMKEKAQANNDSPNKGAIATAQSTTPAAPTQLEEVVVGRKGPFVGPRQASNTDSFRFYNFPGTA